FFQAEDGIRDRNVTGVQTCALPICLRSYPIANVTNEEFGRLGATSAHGVDNYDLGRTSVERGQIGFLEKLEFRTRAINGEESGGNSILFCERYGLDDPAQHVIA